MNCRFVLLVLSVSAATCFAVVVPDGLGPGDAYHLTFVTDGKTDASQSDIDVYNRFVQEQAALNPSLTGVDVGVSWFVIGSTATVDARDNAQVVAPVFRLDGSRVADSFDDMWDGDLQSPINVTQFLETSNTDVWTGSLDTGLARRSSLGDGRPGFGHSSGFRFVPPDHEAGWLNQGFRGGGTMAADNPRSFYALSSRLIVVPEPSGVSLTLLLLATWAVRRRLAAYC